MTDRRQRQAHPQAIPYEARCSASEGLIELADTMMRSAQALIRQSGRLLNPDPNVHGRVIISMRRHANSGLPGSGHMDFIEARLFERSAKECASHREKLQAKKRDEDRERDQTWRDIRKAENSYLEHCRQFNLDPSTGRPRPETVKTNGNVVEGPWPDAS